MSSHCSGKTIISCFGTLGSDTFGTEEEVLFARWPTRSWIQKRLTCKALGFSSSNFHHVQSQPYGGKSFRRNPSFKGTIRVQEPEVTGSCLRCSETLNLASSFQCENSCLFRTRNIPLNIRTGGKSPGDRQKHGIISSIDVQHVSFKSLLKWSGSEPGRGRNPKFFFLGGGKCWYSKIMSKRIKII